MLGLLLGAGLSVLAFVTTGGTTDGTNLGPNTWAQIVLVLIAAGLGITAVLVCARSRVWGAVSLCLLATLAGLTVLSISWSVQPENSWLDANLMISYVAAFGGGLALARIAPEHWRAIVVAVAVVSIVVSAYALLSKVFPATVYPSQTLFGARLSGPFGYWNAVGLMAALGLPACVWLGARRDGPSVLRVLSVPAIGVLVVTIVLASSRGAVVAALVGLACWFLLVPLRLRGVLVLALGSVAGGLVTLWALGSTAITTSGQSLQARIAAGHHFGLVLVGMLVVSLGFGVGAAFAADRVVLSDGARRRIGIALLALLACVPVVAAIGLSASSRGLTGEISHEWNQLTGTDVGAAGLGPGTGRLLNAGNLHAQYWSEGIKIGEHDLLKGVGGLGFGVASQRYSATSDVAANAHSYVIETFADFGLLGLVVSIALLVAWAVAAARAVGLRRSAPEPALAPTEPSGAAGPAPSPTASTTPEPAPGRWAAERAGLLTLLSVVVIFGVHSTIDWTWFIPGLAVPALLCAGWLAGRGPLDRPVGRAPRPRPPLLREPRDGLPRRLQRAVVAAPGRVAAVAAIAALALVCAWTVWQPLRSSNADAAALAAFEANHPGAALADIRSAATIDPFSTEPFYYQWDIYSLLGDTAAARAALAAEVALQPSDAATWLQLGQYDATLGQRRRAISELEAALRLFPHDLATQNALAQAQSGG